MIDNQCGLILMLIKNRPMIKKSCKLRITRIGLLGTTRLAKGLSQCQRLKASTNLMPLSITAAPWRPARQISCWSQHGQSPCALWTLQSSIYGLSTRSAGAKTKRKHFMRTPVCCLMQSPYILDPCHDMTWLLSWSYQLVWADVNHGPMEKPTQT